MKKVKIKYCDWWPGFDYENSHLTNVLRERYDVEFSNSPDFVICGAYSDCFGKEAMKYDCVRIFYTGEAVAPNFIFYDYSISYDDIEFGDRHLRMPLFCGYYNNDYQRQIEERRNISVKDIHKKRFAAFVYSNNNAMKLRTDVFNRLSAYKRVESGGAYLNNQPGGKRCDDKIEFQSHCKFSIAFENASYRGYTSEKILDAFASGTVPIYYGNPDIYKDIRKGSFINAHEYSSLDELVSEVIRIDQDDEVYMQMINMDPFVYNPDSVKKNEKEFIYHIFDQRPEDAFRRNMDYMGKSINERERTKNSAWPITKLYVNRFTRKIKETVNKPKRG